jgi:hypothetical protein
MVLGVKYHGVPTPRTHAMASALPLPKSPWVPE